MDDVTFEYSIPAEEHQRFAPGVAQSWIGRTIPVATARDGSQVMGTIQDAKTNADGTALLVTVKADVSDCVEQLNDETTAVSLYYME